MLLSGNACLTHTKSLGLIPSTEREKQKAEIGITLDSEETAVVICRI